MSTYIGKYMYVSVVERKRKVKVCGNIRGCRLEITNPPAVDKMIQACNGRLGVVPNKRLAINHVVGRHGFVPFVYGV